MRERIARRIVCYVSDAMDHAYLANCNKDEKAEKEWRQIFKKREKYALPIALKLDKWNATEQMANEGWWG